MSNLIQLPELKEGELFCKWMHNRLIRSNKNVLGVELGPTGSGKSYRDLRKAELWYKYHFNEEFPAENICFGVASVIKLISKGKLRRGDVIIFEEAGVNLGNLDFQQKISKMFTYVLQSFRSMNIAIFFNLPYFSMLNKSARMLMHYQFESAGIDQKIGENICKPFFVQVNQSTGKPYRHYPWVYHKGNPIKIERLGFMKPSQYLLDAYEEKKQEYLTKTIGDFSLDLDEKEKETTTKIIVDGKGPEDILTPRQYKEYKLYFIEKKSNKEIAEISETAPSSTHKRIQIIKKKLHILN